MVRTAGTEDHEAARSKTGAPRVSGVPKRVIGSAAVVHRVAGREDGFMDRQPLLESMAVASLRRRGKDGRRPLPYLWSCQSPIPP